MPAPFGREAIHRAYTTCTGKPLSPRERKGLESVLNSLTRATAVLAEETHMAMKRKNPRLPPAQGNDNRTEKKQTLNLALATAIAIVAAIIGALFGSLASFSP